MTFAAEILEIAQARGAAPALVEVHGSKLVPTSGEELSRMVACVRSFLRSKQVAPGDRVALLGANSTRWAAVDLAIMAEGAICVPLYARQDPAQLAGMLQDAAPVLLVAADEALRRAIESAWPGACSIVGYDEVFASAPLPPGEPHAAPGPVTIIYTSGTSGEPKGVVLTDDNVRFMLDVTVARIAEMSQAGRPEDRVFHYLPFCFAGSRIMLWSQLRRGNPLWLSTDLNNLQEEMRTASPHYFMNVPMLLERIRNGVEQKLAGMGGVLHRLYQKGRDAHRAVVAGSDGMQERMWLGLASRTLFPRIKRLIGPNLEFLVCGSAPLNEDTQRWFQMIGLPVYQVYGLTETTGIVTIDDTKNVVPGRVGHVIPGCEMKVTSEGELICRGPNVFAGYFRRPEATAQMIRDGWLYTGDQAEIDAHGNLRILGRLKDVIVPESGHNVAPSAIEEKLVSAGLGIEQAVVIGHGRRFLTAIVTGPIRESELAAACEKVNASLPHYQRLRRLHRAPEPFTPENGLLTANQKLRRAAIEAHYRREIEEMYA